MPTHPESCSGYEGVIIKENMIRMGSKTTFKGSSQTHLDDSVTNLCSICMMFKNTLLQNSEQVIYFLTNPFFCPRKSKSNSYLDCFWELISFCANTTSFLTILALSPNKSA